MSMLGAEARAVDIQETSSAQGAWLRYLQDHSSKRKQEQIPDDIGRHWGIVGRRLWKTADPDEVIQLDEIENVRYLRMIQRLSTPSKKDQSKPFGRKLLKRNRRGRLGSSVWFGKPETHRRAAEWAKGGRILLRSKTERSESP
jgi:hypothetical protein